MNPQERDSRFIYFRPLGSNTSVKMDGCGVCNSCESVRLERYVDAGYQGECDGCNQHVGQPVYGMTAEEAVISWNLTQRILNLLMYELPDGVSISRR